MSLDVHTESPLLFRWLTALISEGGIGGKVYGKGGKLHELSELTAVLVGTHGSRSNKEWRGSPPPHHLRPRTAAGAAVTSNAQPVCMCYDLSACAYNVRNEVQCLSKEAPTESCQDMMVVKTVTYNQHPENAICQRSTSFSHLSIRR
jgi:hypothetical protein